MSVKVKNVLDALQQMQKSLECSICLELLKDPHSTKCNHQFCGHCIRQVLEKSSKKSKNKWYCPLCKTPVSKRSLTPNPKLSEIVAAVRNLQGAVQDDTGIPTGSPPSQPFKSHSTGSTSDVGHVSNLQPTSQKCVTGCRGKQNAPRKNQFSVYIDNNENEEQALKSKQPQVVSNINIRSSLRPLSVTQTISKNTKSNKVINTKTTRRTRNSKRILAQKGHLEDINVGKNGNEELLHMIDTMTFKPVCNAVAGSSKDFILDPSTLESKPDLISVLSLDSSTSTKTVSTVKDGTGSKGTSLGTSVQQEITTCLTTIAEADSSIRTSPSGASAGLFGNKISLHDENTANSKNDEGAVSSSKIESALQSSLDTMQSVSILSSLDCAVALGVCDDSQKEDNHDNITYQSDEQNKLISIERCNLEKQEKTYDAAHDNACNENLGLDKCLNKDIDFQIQCDEGNKLTSTNLCDPKIQEIPFEMCEERQTRNHHWLSEPVDATVPSERDLTEQSLDFEGLVSLFDDPSNLNKPQEAMQQEETINSSPHLGKSAELLQQARTVNEKTPLVKPMESLQQAITLNTNPSLGTSEKGKIPPSSKADMQVNETTDPSDLCERVKQRQRRRTFEMPLTSKRYSDSPKTSRSEQKPLKRSANSVIDFKTRDGPSPEGSAKKRFKASEDPLPGQASPMMANTAREKTGGVIGVYSEQLQQEKEGTMTAKGDRWTCVDELGVDSYSCSSGKTVHSNEVIPASVSSSGNSNSAAINPMIVYANQASEENQGGARRRKDKWSSQIKQIEEDNHKNNTGKRISIDDYPPNLVTRKKSSQDEKRNNVESNDEDTLNDEESSTDFTRSQQLSGQKPFVCVTDLQSNCSKQISFKGKERKAAQSEDEDTIRENVSQRLKTGEIAESQSFDPCEKALLNALASDSSQFKEDDMTEARQVDIDDDNQAQGNIFISSQNSSQGQKHLKNFPCSNISGDSENDGQIKGKCRNRVAVDSGAKTSELLSQEAHNSNSTPTQSSLEVDALTPCLFGNNSWETPEKKVSQKRSRISKHLHEEIIKNNDYSEADSKADFERMRTLDDSKARNAEQHIFGVVQSPASNTKEVTSDADPEGTQSFGTSQSISVLHDLEFPAQEQQESTIRNEGHSCHSAENSNAEAKSDNSWAEPLPKKSRSGQQSESQEVYSNMSFKHLSCPNNEKPHGSDCTESDVIPPTPPVKLATKQVFGSDAQSSLRMLHSKIKPQRKDEANCYSERLAVKKKKRIRSPRCSKSPRLQDNKGDGAITHCSSVGSEMNEASVSLLENHPRSVNAEAKSLRQAMELEFDTDLSLKSKRMKSSQDRNTETAVNNSGVIPNKSPKGLTRFSKSGKKRHVVEHVSLPKLDEPRYSQRKTDSQVSQNVRQIHVHEDLKDSPSSQVESVNSSPCSPVKQRVDHVGDSFDWSETRDTLKGNGDSQSDPITFDNGNDEEDEHLTGGEDEDCCSALLNSPRASQACHEVEDKAEYPENPIIGNVRNRDSLSVVDKGDSIFTDDDKGESSGDEALLKPVFLPKESKSLASESSCKEDAHDNAEEVEVTVFSQELIPSENDDDNGDGISSSYKALDSTGASSATFLSETAASTQKMDVLREDVEAMEKEMEELRAYLATTDEKREGAENTNGDMDYEEADEVDDADVQPSLTPPPPLTPKSIPPMRQLSTPLKDVSRYLDQEGQSSDESSECEGAKSNEPVKRSEPRRSSCYEGHKRNTDKNDSRGKTTDKRPFSPSYEDDGLSITPVEQRREETPSPPHSSRSTEKSEEKDEDQLIVIDDRDALHSKTASLLLGKRRKLVHDLVPRKSPVVSLLFTRAGKDSEKTSQSPQPVMQPAMRKSSPFIYSRKRCSTISPIRGQDPPRTVSREDMSRERVSREVVTGESASRDNESRNRLSSKSVSREGLSHNTVSRDSVSHNSMSPERESYDQCYSPDLVVTKVKDLTNKKYDKERENRTSARHMSFVATRLNRQQLAEARTLAETYGGKLASEFNSKTSHVIMATDENMQVTRHSYTMKYLLGLALGKWVVSHRWIAACKQAKTLVTEADYEVKGDSGLGQNSIPRVARTARNNKETLLFEDFDVLCCGGFSTAVTKEQLSQLLKFCGAQVYLNADNLKRTEKGRQKVVIIDKETRDNVNEIKAICRQLNTKPVSLEWVTDSIANYKVQDLRDYIVEL